MGWLMLALSYLTVGLYLGLVAGWEATAYRPAMPRPTLDVAVGVVVLVVAVTWPVWVVGWGLWTVQGRRNRRRTPRKPGWLSPHVWAGAGVLTLIAAIMWEQQP